MKKYQITLKTKLVTEVEALNEEQAVDKAEAILFASVNNSAMYFDRAISDITEIKDENNP